MKQRMQISYNQMAEFFEKLYQMHENRRFNPTSADKEIYTLQIATKCVIIAAYSTCYPYVVKTIFKSIGSKNPIRSPQETEPSNASDTRERDETMAG